MDVGRGAGWRCAPGAHASAALSAGLDPGARRSCWEPLVDALETSARVRVIIAALPGRPRGVAETRHRGKDPVTAGERTPPDELRNGHFIHRLELLAGLFRAPCATARRPLRPDHPSRPGRGLLAIQPAQAGRAGWLRFGSTLPSPNRTLLPRKPPSRSRPTPSLSALVRTHCVVPRGGDADHHQLAYLLIAAAPAGGARAAPDRGQRSAILKNAGPPARLVTCAMRSGAAANVLRYDRRLRHRTPP